MNYSKIYADLIERAKNRILDGYSENHHITPKCMGGIDEDKNMVRLTPEEHYLAHQLLVKIFTKSNLLKHAAMLMTVNSPSTPRPKNKVFGWLKRLYAVAVSEQMQGNTYASAGKGIKQSEEHVKNRVKSRLNNGTYTHTEETKLKISNIKAGQIVSDETRKKLSKAKTGTKRSPLSDETKQRISIAKKGLQVPWNKGKKGTTPWNKGKKGLQVAWNKGRKLNSGVENDHNHL